MIAAEGDEQSRETLGKQHVLGQGEAKPEAIVLQTELGMDELALRLTQQLDREQVSELVLRLSELNERDRTSMNQKC